MQRRAERHLRLVHLKPRVVQVDVGAERGVADAEEDHGAGHALEQVSKVLTYTY